MNSHELLGCVCVCVRGTNHSIKHLLKYNYIYNIYLNIYKPTWKFQHFNCRIAFFLLVFLSSYPHPTQHFFNTSVVMCTCGGTHLFHNCTFFSRGFYKHEKTHIIVYKGSLLPQRFKLSFFTNIIPKYRLCFRNTTFFTKVLLCFLFTH